MTNSKVLIVKLMLFSSVATVKKNVWIITKEES